MLNRFFPHMYDSPDKGQVMGGLSFGVVPFLLLPFTLTVLVFDTGDIGPRLVLEYIYIALNFILLLSIFRPYLADSWLNVTVYPKRFLGVCLGATALIGAIYGGITWAAIAGLFDKADTVALGILPMAGVELMLLPGDFVLESGILAVAALVLAGPFITACMFYTTAFAPVCVGGHRFAAYLSVAALTALPRIITYFTVWGGWKEPQLFLAQLPIHWLACWTYQKTDTVWAPICTHAAANALSCAVLYGLLHFGYIS